MLFLTRIEDPIYPSSIWFTNSYRLFHQKRSELLDRHDEIGVCDGICSSSDSGLTNIIGLFDDHWDSLVHECNHAAINVFEAIGLPITREASEAFTYYSSFIFKQCMKHYVTWHDKTLMENI